MSVKETMNLTFKTGAGKARSLSLPAPRQTLDGAQVRAAVSRILAADVFDGAGRPVSLERAARVRVETDPLFG